MGKLIDNPSSGGGGLSNINVSAGATSNNLSALTFDNSNGVSFGITGSVITATVATNYQSAGAYLTTAALSGDTTKYAGVGESTGTVAGTALGLTMNTDGASILYPNWLTTAQAPGAYLTTAALSGDTTKYAGVGESSATVAGTDINFTMNTDGLSLLYPKYITTYVNDLTSGRAGVGESSGTVAGTDLNFTMNTDGLSILYPKWITTYAAGAGTGISGVGASDTTYSSGTVIWSGQNNVTIGSSVDGASQYVRLSVGNYITTGALSDHSHGNPTLNLTNLSGTTASASNGFTLSLSAAAAGGVNPAASASNGSFAFTTINFSNANNVTFGTSAGGIITASVAAPGGGGDKTASFWEVNNGIQSTCALWNNATYSNRPLFFPFQIEKAITAISSIRIFASRTGGTSAAATLFAGIYTIANSTSMNLVSSTSFNLSVTTSAQFSGIRGLNFTGLGAMSLSPGQYVLGLQASMPATASWGMNLIGNNSLALGGWLLPGTNSTAATASGSRLLPFAGVWNATSAGLPSAVGTASISGGNGANSPKPYFAFLAIP